MKSSENYKIDYPIDVKELKKYCNPSYVVIRDDKLIVSNKRYAKLSKEKMKNIERDFGIPVVYSRVYEEISEKMGRFVAKYNIINPRNNIVVGLSGGKDSLALLHLLEPYRRKFGISITAITADLNIDGKRPWGNIEENTHLKKVHEQCEHLRIPHKIISHCGNVVEMSRYLTENAKVKGIEYSPCFSCSLTRRHIITNYIHDNCETFETNGTDENKKNNSKNYNNHKNYKIAFGHTLEDNSDTILANMFKGDKIKSLAPIKEFTPMNVPFDEFGFNLDLKPCTIIRPILAIKEEKIVKALEECDIWYYKDKDECPYSRANGDGIRKRAHFVLKDLEKSIPNVREMVISSTLKTIGDDFE
ncbi:tRNA(Ile)-lysidine synthase TilS/MesJ [Methanococcus voltae]|uniref:tRNA(Ile)-lysidine synthase TilS/MesJ n=1 Tax=Methanococcus voltae TaxID=2188 RepID=A0A8J7UUQ8_METVO|nr:tRNA 2-thiocytidine biosynthesis TtcA family protein [Methanococcus voltae]MBP2201586.1 tRNA(Ile)-lysidine synthase TilS/MesJ [Methanococcus voltae]